MVHSVVLIHIAEMTIYPKNVVQSGAAGRVRGFETGFLEVPLALIGQNGSCSSAQLPVELSDNMLQNLFLDLPPHSVEIGPNQ